MTIHKLAYGHGCDLYGVAYALGSIGNLLGADASDHAINETDRDGLAHAIISLGLLVKVIGGDLCEAFDPDELEKLAPQKGNSANRGASCGGVR
ncbi:hypothetical protein [Pseudomonas coronafaciens]|uniref:Uncharacterized protein n=1 Tax=Pseudomonas coronafaciens pv. coronafaciens TaxID=235275 RepID=A0AAE6UKD7_9PSED|nr:hypothetical protein [Pseudomonas coronafaciens]QGT80410.1 hypothetical protein GMO17_04075 [Pseudomonas coronafaciens pv. coronafaciens]